MTPVQGVEDVVPGIVNPGGPPLPSADTSADGHPKKKKKKKKKKKGTLPTNTLCPFNYASVENENIYISSCELLMPSRPP